MVKIDIISGFLGAGKTTFANMLLRYYLDLGLRPVYIVNEFGETGLDAEIIRADGFDAIEMDGGCICCTLKDDVTTSIIKVMNAFSPTNIVFEPCGIFIFDDFCDLMKQPVINSRCELGSVITIVDSVNFTFAKAIYGSFIYNQIKNASVILLSKLEKASQSTDEIICDIKNINPEAFIMSKVWAGWDTTDFKHLLKQNVSLPMNHRGHYHDKLHSITVKLDRIFTQEDINGLIACCKSDIFGNLCRVKGVLLTNDKPILLNIALQDVTLVSFNGLSEPSLTFVGQSVNEAEISKFLTTYY